MPSLPIIGTPGLVPQESVEAGTGVGGINEVLGSVEHGIGTAANLVQQHQDEQARIWAGAAASNVHIAQLQAIQQQRDDAAATVANGGAVPDMTGGFLKGYDEQAQGVINSAPNAVSKRYLQDTLNQTRVRLGDQMVGEQAQLTRQWKLSTATTTADNAAKIVQQDPSQFDAQMGNIMATMPHIDPLTDASHALRTREALTNAAASSTLDRDPRALKDLTGKAMGEIDPATGKPFSGPTGTGWIDQATPEQVKTWNTAAEAKIRILDNQAAMDANARERQAQQTFGTLQGFVAQGSVPDLAYTARVKADTAGTSFEGSANAALDIASRGAGFGSAALPMQQARLQQMQTQQAAGTNPEDAGLLKQLQTIHDTQASAYKDDPLDAASRFAHVQVLPTQQVANVTQGLQLVTQRAAALPSVEAAAGAPASPLHPQEAAQLGKLIRSMQPDQAASALSTLGKTIADPQRIAALAKQFGDTDGTLGLAMAYAGDGQKSTGRLVAGLLLQGDQALKDKRSEVEVQKQEGWRAAAATAIRGAFSDVNVENQAIDAAVKVNAATSIDGKDDMDRAVTLVTGGIIQHGAAGAKIPMPYGMQYASDFEKKISALTPASFSSQVSDGVVHAGAATIPLQQFVSSLPDATLIHAGQGLYRVRSGTTQVTNSQGQPIWIRVTP